MFIMLKHARHSSNPNEEEAKSLSGPLCDAALASDVSLDDTERSLASKHRSVEPQAAHAKERRQKAKHLDYVFGLPLRHRYARDRYRICHRPRHERRECSHSQQQAYDNTPSAPVERTPLRSSRTPRGSKTGLFNLQSPSFPPCISVVRGESRRTP